MRDLLNGAAFVIALIVSVLVVGNIIASGHAAATAEADVEVIGQTCADGSVTELRLHISQESAPSITFTPHVWSSRQHVQFPWRPENVTVYDGGRNVTISAPDERAVIEGDRAQVWLATGQQRTIENFEVRRCS